MFQTSVIVWGETLEGSLQHLLRVIFLYFMVPLLNYSHSGASENSACSISSLNIKRFGIPFVFDWPATGAFMWFNVYIHNPLRAEPQMKTNDIHHR